MINLTQEIFGIGDVFFTETGKPKYMDDNYFKSRFYDFIKSVEKGKRSRSNCSYPGCFKKSIKNSHVIPENVVLKNIAKNNKVLYPKHLKESRSYSIESVHISSASTFPGFCLEHEKLFFGFEQKDWDGDTSISLQNIRIICRDNFLLRNMKKYLMLDYERYKKEIFSYNNHLIESYNKLTGKAIKLMSIRDEIVKDFENKLKLIDENIAELEKDLYLFKEAYEKKTDGVINYVFHFPCRLPIALAGKSNFEILLPNKSKEKFTVYLSILPQKDETLLNFTFANELKENVNMILANFITDLEMLSFIESFIIYGSDYWFINPDVWNNFSLNKQKKIKEDLLITSYYPVKELSYSIFDNVRKHIIGEYKKNNRDDMIDMLNHEAKKLEFFAL